MTRVLVISDTHGFLDPKLYPHIEEADEVWHGGDIGPGVAAEISKMKALTAVYGNIDDAATRREFPRDQVLTKEGLKVVMTHIAGYPGRYNAIANALIGAHHPAILICGHSHILKVMRDPKNGHLHINPGACGIHGFHHVKTAVRMEIHEGHVSKLDVIETGKRNAL